MNDPDPSASSENRSSEPEPSLTPRGLTPGTAGAMARGNRQSTTEAQQLKIVLHIERAESLLGEAPKPTAETSDPPLSSPPLSQDANLQTPAPPETSERRVRAEADSRQIPARMLNEFVYCQRLFYYEFVEGVFVESVDTLRGDAIHQRVDSGNGALPAAKGKTKAEKTTTENQPAGTGDASAKEPEARDTVPEIIHSRSVQMGSERLGVVAKMDLVEVRAGLASGTARAGVATGEAEDLFAALEVCPVDYKAGAPKEGEEDGGRAGQNELWDTDKMQLGLQALILRDNGYSCNEGVIYYRATKQRVRLPITPELERWILQNIADAKRVSAGPIPAPLVHSPKCVRCSLAPVCLPDETRMLAQTTVKVEVGGDGKTSAGPQPNSEAPRRLVAARDDTRPLYLNTQGYRVGCKDEVLVVKEKDRVIDEVRIRDVSHVALFGNVQISTQAIQSLCEQEVPVTYFSMGGWFYGITRGHALKNVFLRMEQFRLARDEKTCRSLARQFVHGKIRNQRTLLMRNHLEPPEGIIGKLKRASEDALTADSVEELLGIEGAAAGQYFQQFSGMVKVDDDLPASVRPSKVASSECSISTSPTATGVRPPIRSTPCFHWPTACWQRIAHWRRWPWASILIWDSTTSPVSDDRRWVWI